MYESILNVVDLLADVNIEVVVVLSFDVGLEVSHLKVVVDPVNHEIREPRIGSTSLEEFIEQLEAVLSEVVTKYFETHQSLVLGKGLSEESQTHIVYLVVSHVQVDQRLVNCNSLSDGLGSIVTALVVGQVEGLQTAVVRLQVLGDRLTASEAYFVGVEVQNLKGIVLEQVLHDNIKAVIA